VSEIGVGAWAIGGPFEFDGRPIGWGKVNDEVSRASLHAAFERGVNFIDTADIYGLGHSEELVGKVIPDAPHEIVVATKVGYLREAKGDSRQDFSREYLTEACEESLRRLGREAIDLYQLHSPPPGVIESGEAFGTLEELKRSGKILHYGVSVKSDADAVAAMQCPGVEAVQLVFNMMRQRPARTVFPEARRRNVGILARVPLASGLLTGKFTLETKFEADDHRSTPIPGETFSGLEFDLGVEVVEKLRFLEQEGGPTLAQVALLWILAFDAVSAVIPGVKTPQQVAENVATSGGGMLPDVVMDHIHFIYQKYVAPVFEESQ